MDGAGLFPGLLFRRIARLVHPSSLAGFVCWFVPGLGTSLVSIPAPPPLPTIAAVQCNLLADLTHEESPIASWPASAMYEFGRHQSDGLNLEDWFCAQRYEPPPSLMDREEKCFLQLRRDHQRSEHFTITYGTRPENNIAEIRQHRGLWIKRSARL